MSFLSHLSGKPDHGAYTHKGERQFIPLVLETVRSIIIGVVLLKCKQL